MSSTLNIALIGSSGKMGQALRVLSQDKSNNFNIAWDCSGRNENELTHLYSVSPYVDVVIDFSHPKASLLNAKLCAQKNWPCLIGTTGFSDVQHATLRQSLTGHSSFALVPNTSIGISKLIKALHAMASLSINETRVSIIETHHAQKKDAPSGTTKMLCQELETMGFKNIEIESRRIGTEPGEHRVLFSGHYETLEFIHCAKDRKLFALGALHLAQSLCALAKKSGPKEYIANELFASM